MSGVSGSGSGFDYAEAFLRGSTDSLQKDISSGMDKSELNDAAIGILMYLAYDFETNATESSKTQFIELGQKYVEIFADDNEGVKGISEFAQNVLGTKLKNKAEGASTSPASGPEDTESPALKKVVEGKIGELSLEEIQQVVIERDSLTYKVIPDELSNENIANAVLNYVKTHTEEIKKDPTVATRAHHILHDLAQREIEEDNVEEAFKIESLAATTIPLSESHPLHEMDKAILQGASRQYDPKTGAHFSSLDTSIVKGGNLHATQRKIDGKLTNTFDFKISHYARDQLSEHLEAVVGNPVEFEASLPKGFCKGVTINEGVPQQYIRYDESSKEFTRTGAYCPAFSTATEIVFEGVGKVIIGTDQDVGCMFNWVQVEMDANLPPGEGAKKLQQMLTLAGLGPVIGQQPSESDERMKIAQILRAYYPAACTEFDTTYEFYHVPVAELRKEIEELMPDMKPIFAKYLDTSPHLMKKVEIMPGKEIWGIADLGQQIKAKGAYGLMTGVGNSGDNPVEQWNSAKRAVVRMLTQGAMSSEQRFQSGVFKAGASSEDDLCSGGGDQVFTRMVNDSISGTHLKYYPFSGQAQILWNLETVAERVPYGFTEDSFGVKNRFHDDYSTYENRTSLMELAENLMEEENEVMVKNALDPSHISGVLVNSTERKKELIQHLVDQGLAEDRSGTIYIKLNNVKAEDFIHVGTRFRKKMWG